MSVVGSHCSMLSVFILVEHMFTGDWFHSVYQMVERKGPGSIRALSRLLLRIHASVSLLHHVCKVRDSTILFD